MPLNKEQKQSQVSWFENVLNDNEVIVVMRNSGLTVAEVTDLRNQMREAGGGVKVVKNRLAKIAIGDRPGSDVKELFTGPTVIAYSEDPVTAPKVVVKWAKDHDALEILGGLMGETALDAPGVDSLSKMPSREEVISQIAASLTAPGANISAAAGAPAANIAGILKTLAEKEEA
jgi:large subunit ribosomal protein L10